MNMTKLQLVRLSVAVVGLLLAGCGQTEDSAGNQPQAAGAETAADEKPSAAVAAGNRASQAAGAKTASTGQPESETLKLCEELRAALQRARSAASRTDLSAEQRIAESMVGMVRSLELRQTIRDRIEASEKGMEKEESRGDFFWEFHCAVAPLLPQRREDMPVAADKNAIKEASSDKGRAEEATAQSVSPAVANHPDPAAESPAKRTTPLGKLPDHFHDVHLDFLLQVLEKHRPELAVRLRKKELQDTVWFLFKLCSPDGWHADAYDRQCEMKNPVYSSVVQSAVLKFDAWSRSYADYIARFTYEVADPKQRLEELETEGVKERKQGAPKPPTSAEEEHGLAVWNEVFGKSPQQQSEDYFEGKGEHPFQAAYPLVKKHLPDEAARYAAFVRRWHANQMELQQGWLTDAVWDVFRAQTILRDHDADKNGVQDYWTADVSGLLLFKVEGRPLREIYRALTDRIGDWDKIVQSDAAPLTPGEGVYAVAADAEPFKYGFQAVRRDSDGKPYAPNTQEPGRAWRNRDRFAVCAFPREYPGAGRQTYLINETGVIWFKDTAGKPVEQFPKDLEAEGWSRAAKQPIEAEQAEQQQRRQQDRAQMLVNLQQGKLDVDTLIRVLGSGTDPLPSPVILELVKRHDTIEPGLAEAEKMRKAMRLVARSRLPELVTAFKARVGVTTHWRQTVFTLKELSAGESDQSLEALVKQWQRVSIDDSLRDRVDAALSLWCYDGRANGVQPLLTTAVEADDIETRRSAIALAVHAIENLDDLSQIISKTADDESPDIRMTAIRAATRFYQKPDASKLSSFLIDRLSDSEPDVIDSALESLVMLRDQLNLSKQQRAELIARVPAIFGNRELSKLHDNLLNVLVVTGWEYDSEADDAVAIFEFLSRGGHIPNLELPEVYGDRVWGTSMQALQKRAGSDGPSGTSARRILLNLGPRYRRVLAQEAERRLGRRLSVVPNEIYNKVFQDVSDKILYECVSANRNLRDIPLHGTSVTDDGMALLHSVAHLQGLNELRVLDVSGTSISDVGAKSISGLASLETLNISFTGLTDEGLAHLKSLKNLKQLDVSSTRVTATGLREFQMALPQCKTRNEPPLRASAATKSP